MNNLYNNYSKLKQENKDLVYLFKSGVFYVALEEDAKLLSKMLDLKINTQNKYFIKCGFPVSKIEKYKIFLDNMNIKYQIIEELEKDSINYSPSLEVKKLIELINSRDIDSLSIMDTYKHMKQIQNLASKIKFGGFSNENKYFINLSKIYRTFLLYI